MAKRIVVLNIDGTERVLDKVPNLREMQKIVGGYIEHVRVMDRLENGEIVLTSMFVNEHGLIENLPRNPKATELYQRLSRHQFPDAENPFQAARDAWRAQVAKLGASAFVIDSTPAEIAPGYHRDPWIAGPAIFFEGYRVEEVDELL